MWHHPERMTAVEGMRPPHTSTPQTGASAGSPRDFPEIREISSPPWMADPRMPPRSRGARWTPRDMSKRLWACCPRSTSAKEKAGPSVRPDNSTTGATGCRHGGGTPLRRNDRLGRYGNASPGNVEKHHARTVNPLIRPARRPASVRDRRTKDESWSYQLPPPVLNGDTGTRLNGTIPGLGSSM
jgi:hypothetical protein